MGQRSQILRTGLKVIDELLKGPYTAGQIADSLGLGKNQAYIYINTISEFLPVQSQKRKLNWTGRHSIVYWLES